MCNRTKVKDNLIYNLLVKIIHNKLKKIYKFVLIKVKLSNKVEYLELKISKKYNIFDLEYPLFQ